MFLSRRHVERWSEAAGSYSPNAFSIQLPSSTSVIDPVSLQLIQNNPENLSVLVHEYWHYIQNLTTVAGLISLVLQQHFVAAFSETLYDMADGTSVGSNAVGGDLPARVQELIEIFQAREGDLALPTIEQEEVRSFRITSVHEDEYDLSFRNIPVPLRKIVLDIEVEMSDGSNDTEQLVFGQACVEEGIAYLVDRMVAGEGTGSIGPENAPPFPYRILRELALTGSTADMTSVEIASLGTLALLTPDPAGIFLELRDGYAHARSAGRSIIESLDEVWQQMRSNVEVIIQVIEQHEIPSLLAMHQGRGLVEIAFEWLARQYMSLLQKRRLHPLFDLYPFANNGLNRVALSNLLRTLLPCDIVIGQAGGLHDVERDILISFGMPGLFAHGYRLSDLLRTLEAQQHFVLSHLGRDGFLTTEEVENDRAELPDSEVSACPFYSSCGLELRQTHSEICFRRPWRIFDQTRPNCWYGTAVSCTLGPTSLANTIQDISEQERIHQSIVLAVKRRAYELWEIEGGIEGRDWRHWFQARCELGIPDDYHL